MGGKVDFPMYDATPVDWMTIWPVKVAQCDYNSIILTLVRVCIMFTKELCLNTDQHWTNHFQGFSLQMETALKKYKT